MEIKKTLTLRHYQIVTYIVTLSLPIKLKIFREYICEVHDSGFRENAAVYKNIPVFRQTLHLRCVEELHLYDWCPWWRGE
jgi:hypothetical protein